MRTILHSLGCRWLPALALVAVQAPWVRAVVVDFDTPGQFVNNFSINGNYGQVGSGGITGGGVQTAFPDSVSSSSAVYNVPFSPGALTTQIYFKPQQSSASANLRLGFVGVPNSSISTGLNTYVWVEPRGSSIVLTSNVIGVTTTPINASTPTLTLNNWYRVSLTVTSTGGSNYNAAIDLQDYGPTGLAAGSTLFAGSAGIRNTAAAADSSWYAGFSANHGVLNLVDNFSVAAVPEASAGLFLAAVGVATALGRLVVRQRHDIASSRRIIRRDLDKSII
jgi:hypothetical protein